MDTYVIKIDVPGALVTGVVKSVSAEEARRSLGDRPITFTPDEGEPRSWEEWTVRGAFRTRKPNYVRAASTTFHVVDVESNVAAEIEELLKPVGWKQG